jgi:hypothetical protein
MQEYKSRKNAVLINADEIASRCGSAKASIWLCWELPPGLFI